jgi:hypothetical protein
VNFYQRLIERIRPAVYPEDGEPEPQFVEFASYFNDKTDQQIMYLIFRSYRGKIADGTAKGQKLTFLGLKLLSLLFRPYEISVPDDYVVKSRDLLFMDRRAKLPYFLGKEEPADPKKPDPNAKTRLVVFEADLGVMLKLNDGSISDLRTMPSFWDE